MFYQPQAGAAASVQFDLQYDPAAASLTAIPGDAARSSGKSVYAVDVAPNRRRFLVAGLNQNPLPAGPLVNLFVNLTASAASGTHLISFRGSSSADPLGSRPPTATVDGGINVQGAGGSRLQLAGVLNAGSLVAGAAAPGEIVTLIGSGIGPAAAVTGSPASTNLAGTTVSFDGIPAPLLYAAPNQINVIVPYEVSGAATQILVAGGNEIFAGLRVPVASAAPGIFTVDGSGVGPGVILNEDSSVNSPSNPARAGSVIVIYATGGGQINPAGADGQINPSFSQTQLPMSVKIGGLDSDILYAGGAPALISGVLQINCRVPLNAAGGYAVPIQLASGAILGAAGVTVSIR